MILPPDAAKSALQAFAQTLAGAVLATDIGAIGLSITELGRPGSSVGGIAETTLANHRPVLLTRLGIDAGTHLKLCGAVAERRLAQSLLLLEVFLVSVGRLSLSLQPPC